MSNSNRGWEELHTHKPFMSRALTLSHVSVDGRSSSVEVFCIHGANEDPDCAQEYYKVQELTTITHVIQDIYTAMIRGGKRAVIENLCTTDSRDGVIINEADLPSWALPYIAIVLFTKVCSRTGSTLAQASAEIRANKERTTTLNNKLNETKQECVKLRGDIAGATQARQCAEEEARKLKVAQTTLQNDLNARETELRELKIRLASLAESHKDGKDTKEAAPKKATRHNDSQNTDEESCVVDKYLQEYTEGIRNTDFFKRLPEKLRVNFFRPMFGAQKTPQEEKVATPPKNAHQPKPVTGWGVFDETLNNMFDTLEQGINTALKGVDKLFNDPFFTGKPKKRK